MNTKHIEDREERKTAKRTARKKAEEKSPLKAQEAPRGSLKKKVRTVAKGQRKR
jgi:hypothetical protein